MLRRFTSVIMAVVLFAMTIPSALALSAEEIAQPSIEDILNEYHERTFAAQVESNSNINACSENQEMDTIKQDTIAKLNEAGYEAYDVNPDTFSDVESELKTNLDELGLDPNSSYIIVVSGEDDGTNDAPIARKKADPSFTYTYNGITHTMRYLTIEPDDNMNYVRTDYIDVLKSSQNATAIENCLNSIIYAIADKITQKLYLGTIASICGIKLVNVSTAGPATVHLYGGAEWTRVYTQIYDARMELGTHGRVWLV